MRERLEQVGAQTGFGGDWLRLGGVKLLPDGGIGDRTARIFEPYLAEPGSRGTWVIDPDELPDSSASATTTAGRSTRTPAATRRRR